MLDFTCAFLYHHSLYTQSVWCRIVHKCFALKSPWMLLLLLLLLLSVLEGRMQCTEEVHDGTLYTPLSLSISSHPPHDVFQAVGGEVSVLSGHIHLFTHSPIPSPCDAMKILSMLTWPRLLSVHVSVWLPPSTGPTYCTHLASNDTCNSLSLCSQPTAFWTTHMLLGNASNVTLFSIYHGGERLKKANPLSVSPST